MGQNSLHNWLNLLQQRHTLQSTGLAASLKASAEVKALGNCRFWHQQQNKETLFCDMKNIKTRTAGSLRGPPLPHNESLSLNEDYLK